MARRKYNDNSESYEEIEPLTPDDMDDDANESEENGENNGNVSRIISPFVGFRTRVSTDLFKTLEVLEAESGLDRDVIVETAIVLALSIDPDVFMDNAIPVMRSRMKASIINRRLKGF